MITPFGIVTRKLRLDKGLRLLDLAKKLNLSSSFVSAVETGKKPLPAGYVDSVVKALGLTRAEALELQRAADRSKTAVDIDGLQGSQRELVAAFARKLHVLPPEFLEEIKKQVFKSTAGDVPFKRKRKGLLVAAASTRTLWDFAEKVRSVFVGEDDVCFPIMDVLEFRLPALEEGFHLDVCSHAEMGAEEGLVLAGSNCIKLREDVYEGAWNDVGRHRFTACHELGHYLLHRQVAMARVRDDSHPVYRDAEWQADTFAGGLLLSSRHVAQLGCQENAALQCGMTPMAASVMWAKYRKEGFLPA
jgi:transcriptional regulator with XRE-family HTH domain